ncbi:hypothetical protein QQX98_009627 [Neonectria punicea]|uniref:Uncharacterized protein n=1 Tax=Neonectria punicea TaxID=979145 RepID=A0ABR1GS49_9HYPO
MPRLALRSRSLVDPIPKKSRRNKKLDYRRRAEAKRPDTVPPAIPIPTAPNYHALPKFNPGLARLYAKLEAQTARVCGRRVPLTPEVKATVAKGYEEQQRFKARMEDILENRNRRKANWDRRHEDRKREFRMKASRASREMTNESTPDFCLRASLSMMSV